MLKGMYIAASGMNFQATAVVEGAANLANINTPGYKRTMLVGESFGDYVTRFEHLQAGDRVGLGTRAVGTARHESQGALIRTQNPLNVALSGNGYFQTLAADGRVQATRNGDFILDAAGFLATQTGERILGVDSNPLRVNALTGGEFRIREDGTIFSGNAQVGRLKVVDAPNPGAGNFPVSARFAPVTTDAFQVKQGYLEGSNVNVVTEMVALMTGNRAFSFGQKAITTQDNLLNKVANELGRVQ